MSRESMYRIKLHKFLLFMCCAALARELQAGQFLACVNTVISLLGSCISTFAVSAFVDDGFNIMHVQVRLPSPQLHFLVAKNVRIYL